MVKLRRKLRDKGSRERFGDEFETVNDTDIQVGRFFDPKDDTLTVDEFQDALLIDEHGLNQAVQSQPDLLHRVAKKLALQISRRDAAKQYLANISAQKDAQYRRLGRESEDRTTEKEITAQVLVNAEVVKATDQVLRMEHSVREWQALKEAILARGHALRELVTLYVNEYYADPSRGMSTRNMKDIDAKHARREMARQRRQGLDD